MSAVMIYNNGTQTTKCPSFGDKENRCNQLFQWILDNYDGIWHLCTPGDGQAVIFKDKVDYSYMMTLIAICSYEFKNLQIITFEVMSNHLHILMCGSRDEVLAFHDMLKRKLRMYFTKLGNPVDLNRFGCANVIPADSLDSFRNQIVYINRNNYVVDPDHTPFSYPFGANSYYFSPFAYLRTNGTFGDLFIENRRKLVHSRNIDYPDSWLLFDGYISPLNYVRFDIGEGIFRDARHYFHKISRDIESYKEVAALLGESVYYTDDEISTIIFRICKQNYNCEKPALLPSNAKLELARTLHFDYNADNKKIARFLKIDKAIVDEHFPFRR
jgi:REP element-mobilizing transposase RayT